MALFLRPASGQTPTLVLQAGHTSPVTAVAFSRDGRFLASVAADGQIALWDMQARALLHTARGGGGTPRVLAFAPDGRTLATGSSSGAVVTWDVDTLTPRRTDTAGDAPVAAVAFSPDGRRLAAATWRPETHVIAVFDTDTGTPYPPLAASGGAPRSLAFSPDGATIALGVDGQVTGQNLVELWDSRAGHLARVVASPAQAATCVSFDPSGRLLAATTPEGTVELFDMATLGRVASIRVGGSLACVAWAPEGGVLAAAGSQGGAVCSVGAGAAPRPLQSGGPVRALAWSPDGTLLAGGEGDGHISLWSPLGGRIAGFSAREAFTWTPAFSPDGLLALRGWRDEAGGTDILEWSSAAPVLRALTLRAEPATPTSRARGVRPRRVHAFAPRNEQIATGTPDGRVIITDTRGRVLRTFGGHAGAVTGLAFSADGAFLVSGGADGTVRLWTLATGRLALRLAIGQPVRAVAVSLGAARVAAGAGDGGGGRVVVWNLGPGSVERVLEGTGTPSSLAFSIQGASLLVGAADGATRLFDLRDGSLQRAFTAHHAIVTGVSLSGDGSVAASGSRDGTVMLHDAHEGRLLLTFATGPSPSGSAGPERQWIAFDPNGYFVGSEHAMTLVRWRTGQQAETAERFAHLFFRPDLVERILQRGP